MSFGGQSFATIESVRRSNRGSPSTGFLYSQFRGGATYSTMYIPASSTPNISSCYIFGNSSNLHYGAGGATATMSPGSRVARYNS